MRRNALRLLRPTALTPFIVTVSTTLTSELIEPGTGNANYFFFGHPNIRLDTMTPTTIPPNIKSCTLSVDDLNVPSNAANPHAPASPSNERTSRAPPSNPNRRFFSELPQIVESSPPRVTQKNKKKISENPYQKNASAIDSSCSVILSVAIWIPLAVEQTRRDWWNILN